jgi:ketohexokinase
MNIVCVGAIYIDTILTVPHFPLEDQKLRASKRTRRRGGNCGNTLEVLTQLTEHLGPTPQPQLYLIAVLPSYDSPDTRLIRSKLPNVELDSSCIYRPGSQEAASSYIIQNLKTDSRTIVSINELAEMTVEEFSNRILEIAKHKRNYKAWYHFEVPTTHHHFGGRS